MNEFLKDYYNTASGGNDDADALEKMAQLTLLTKEAEEEGIDLSGLSDDEVMQLADELYGNEAETGGDDLEKEAQAKFEEADFLGRVMAHSMWQELDSIQKEAAGGKEGLARRAWGATMGRLGGAAEGKARDVASNLMLKTKEVEGKKVPSGVARALMRLGGKGGEGVSDVKRMNKALARIGGAARVGSQVGAGAAGAAALGGAGYGGYRGVKALRERGKEKEGSALNALIEQRAIEHLAAAGYVDQQGNVYGPEKTASDNDFNTVVDRAALELLEQNGYPVQWR